MLVQERKAKLRMFERNRWRTGGPGAERARRSILAQDRFLDAFPPLPGQSLALYAAMRGEVGTERIRRRGLAVGAILYYPRVDEDGGLSFFRHREGDGWVPGRFGIREPNVPREAEGLREGFDLVLVPGLAFDRHGRRLGRGIGSYDRFLAGLGEASLKVGLAFSWQVVSEVPVEAWDVPVDVVVTEDGVWRPTRGVSPGA